MTVRRGQIVQYYGDGTLSIFSNSVDAVRCAVAIQKTLSEDPVVPVRVGLHVGDVVVEEHGLLGDAVQERLGHASITTTLEVYGHLFEGIDQAAADAIDEALTA